MEKIIEVKGRKGLDGYNGKAGKDFTGQLGENAGPSGPGEHAGAAYLRLAR